MPLAMVAESAMPMRVVAASESSSQAPILPACLRSLYQALPEFVNIAQIRSVVGLRCCDATAARSDPSARRILLDPLVSCRHIMVRTGAPIVNWVGIKLTIAAISARNPALVR